jgi:protein involved in polysaccharide export with SLBB domain
VSGGVVAPKAVDLHAAPTLAKAITLAGGPKDVYELSHVVVLRGSQVLSADMYPLMVSGDDMGTDLTLQSGDVVIVPTVTAKVTVVGAVEKPGSYPLEPANVSQAGPLRLADAIELAGGTQGHGQARLNQVVILRQSATDPGGQPLVMHEDYSRFLKAGDMSQNPVMQDDDMIVVPEGKQSATTSTLNALSLFGIFHGLLGL